MEIFVETRRLLYNNNGGCLEMETQFFANLFIPILDSCGTGSLMAGKRIHVEKTRALRPPGALLVWWIHHTTSGRRSCMFFNCISELSLRRTLPLNKVFHDPIQTLSFAGLGNNFFVSVDNFVEKVPGFAFVRSLNCILK
jgi:hypothetical protein